MPYDLILRLDQLAFLVAILYTHEQNNRSLNLKFAHVHLYYYVSAYITYLYRPDGIYITYALKHYDEQNAQESLLTLPTE